MDFASFHKEETKLTISDKEVEDIGFIENPQEFIVEYKEPSNEKNKRKEEIVYKYSNNGKGALREAVIIGGKPHFLKYLIQEDGTDPSNLLNIFKKRLEDYYLHILRPTLMIPTHSMTQKNLIITFREQSKKQ